MLNADIKYETKDKKPHSKFQTSKVVDKSAKKIPLIETITIEEKNKKRKAEEIGLLKLKSAQEILPSIIEIKPINKRSSSVVDLLHNDVFVSLKIGLRKSISSKVISNFKQAVEDQRSEEDSISEESKQPKKEETKNHIVVMEKLNKLPMLNEEMGDGEDSMSLE